MIEFCNVSAGYEDALVLKDVSLCVPRGGITSIIGPNGRGKTTLLRAAARQLVLRAGEILLDSKPTAAYGRKEFARKAAFMPQVRSVPSITVESLVAHGRFPYLGLSRKMRAEDKAAVRRAMEDTGVAGWAGRELRELSGGERQRVYIAMALAQDTDIIFLDEPTTYLDLYYQFELLELVCGLNARGKTIVLVLHDLSHALRYSHQVVLMQEGRLVMCAAPQTLFESGKIGAVFRVQAKKTEDGYYFLPAKPSETHAR